MYKNCTSPIQRFLLTVFPVKISTNCSAAKQLPQFSSFIIMKIAVLIVISVFFAVVGIIVTAVTGLIIT